MDERDRAGIVGMTTCLAVVAAICALPFIFKLDLGIDRGYTVTINGQPQQAFYARSLWFSDGVVVDGVRHVGGSYTIRRNR